MTFYLFEFNDSMMGCLNAYKAGTSADTTLSTTHTAKAMPNTAGLNNISTVNEVEREVSLMFLSNSVRIQSLAVHTINYENTNPTSPPNKVNKRFSQSTCSNNRRRVAPYALRMPNSEIRLSIRDEIIPLRFNAGMKSKASKI